MFVVNTPWDIGNAKHIEQGENKKERLFFDSLCHVWVVNECDHCDCGIENHKCDDERIDFLFDVFLNGFFGFKKKIQSTMNEK